MPAADAAQATSPEVKVGTAVILDYEFDWGCDGVSCPTCNGGAGNSRLTFADSAGNLWVGSVDPATGDFAPTDGKGILLDTLAAGPGSVGNGPEWAASQRGSEIVYTRWIDGLPKNRPNTTLGFASQQGGTWTAGAVIGTQGRMDPEASLDLNDPVPREAYFDSDLSGVYWRDMSTGATENAVLASLPPGTRISRRWVSGTTDLVMTAPAPADAYGNVYTQVFLFHTATGLIDQLTFDAVEKFGVMMWNAPEYGGAMVFFTVAGGNSINVYRQIAGPANGAWELIDAFSMPLDTPYVGGPGFFVLNNASWIFFWASADPKNKTGQSRIGIVGIGPTNPSPRMLTSETEPARSRRDPEYFITANGPYIYYNRYAPTGPDGGMVGEGVYRVDTGLGPRQP